MTRVQSATRSGAPVLAHRKRADRVGPLEAYCVGLLLPSERKSVEPMAAATAPEGVSAQHQSLLHFISQGGWSDGKVLGKVREMVVVPETERHGGIEALIIDDTGARRASHVSSKRPSRHRAGPPDQDRPSIAT